ncbi:TPA: terminase family protein, partial [Streptococcus pneumoniae]
MAMRRAVTALRNKNNRMRFRTPGELAMSVDRKMRQTPALELIDKEIAKALRDGGRLIITMPPQEGKSTRVAIWTPIWALMRNPDSRIVVASYAASLARRNAMASREIIAQYGSGAIDPLSGAAMPDRLGLALNPNHRQATSWSVLGAQGGVYASGVSGSLTGRAADVLLIDDPFKNQQQADSAREREKVWEWWTSVAQTRLAPGAAVILIMCMTGDTPVLMADGSERPLRDIRPGDEVATYEGGRLTTSTVKNWRNNGPDSIYRIRMKSGVEVRANARHPFLTVKDGNETWTRLRDLKPGDIIRRATGESGEESPAPQKGVTSPRNARACACPTTTGNGGQTDTGPRLPTRNPVEPPESSTDTESLPTSTTHSCNSKGDGARSAASTLRPGTLAPTGTGSCASTTTTRPVESVACSATTATSPSGTGSHQTSSDGPLTTYNVTPDEVESITPCGVEDVFDVQIDRTENFIANGLVSHNTRWHEDDLAGRLIQHDLRQTPENRLWRVVNIPAVAEEGVPDALGRQPGEALVSARGRSRRDFETIRRSVGERVWTALYQGVPTPTTGGLFAAEDLNKHRCQSSDIIGRVVSVDPS